MRKKPVLFMTAICLSLMLALGGSFSEAYAEDTSWTIFDALGIDNSEIPSGSEEIGDDENPFGRDNKSTSVVSEFYGVSDDGQFFNYGEMFGNLQGDSSNDEFIPYDTGTTGINRFYPASALHYGGEPFYGYNAVEGEFSGDGRKGQMVVLGGIYDYLDPSKGGLCLSFIDPKDPNYGSAENQMMIFEVIPPQGHLFGNNGSGSEDFTKFSYQFQNYLQITTGDFDGDGVDEIAVYIPETSDPRVEVYKLGRETGGELKDWEDPLSWSEIYEYGMGSVDGRIPNMVKLLGKDITQNGVDDLSIAYGYFYGQQVYKDTEDGDKLKYKESDEYTPSKLKVISGSRADPLGSNIINIPVDSDAGDRLNGGYDLDLVRVSLDYGDVTGDGQAELVVSGQVKEDIIASDPNVDTFLKNKNSTTRYLARYVYDGNGDRFYISEASNIDVMGGITLDEDWNYYNTYFSVPGCNTNLAIVKIDGVGTAEHIYLDSVIYQHSSYGFSIKDRYYDMGMKVETDKDGGLLKEDHPLYGDVDFVADAGYDSDDLFQYVEYGAVAADFNGDTHESVSIMQYYPREVDKEWRDCGYDTYDKYHNAYWWWFPDKNYDGDTLKDDDDKAIRFRLIMRGDNEAFFNYIQVGEVELDTETGEQGLINVTEMENWVHDDWTTSRLRNAEYAVISRQIFKSHINTSDDSNIYGGEWLGGLLYFFATPDTDVDTMILSYTGERSIHYTDPKVFAVIASPPVFMDLEELDGGDDYIGNSETSFTGIEGSESNTTSNGTLSVGGFMSGEYDFGGMWKVVYEMEYSHEFTWVSEQASSVEQAITYTTFGGQDTVVLYSVPIEIFKYEAIVPKEISPGVYSTSETETKDVTVTLPYNASVQALPVDEYDEIAAQYPDLLPKVGGEILTHTVGDPDTYPINAPVGANVIDAPFIVVGYGAGASITQELTITEAHTEGVMHSDNFSFSFGAGAAPLVMGFSVGGSYEYGTVTTDLEGSSFGGTLVNMPEDARNLGYAYSAKIFQYMYDNGKYDDENIAFPVINFIVANVTAPPILPDPFMVEADRATADSITCYFESDLDRDITSFEIFNVIEVQGADQYISIGEVPSDDYFERDGLKGKYRFTNEGLEPSSEYRYAIRSLKDSYPVASATSAIVTGYTRDLLGGADVEIDDYLIMYPNKVLTAYSSVSGRGYSPVNTYYNWQKKIGGIWKNLTTQTGSNLLIPDPDSYDEGVYRLVVHDEVDGKYISSYSNQLELELIKRTAEIDGFVDGASQGSLEADKIILTLRNSDSSDPVIPQGDVIFSITGDGYASVQRVELVPDSANHTASAELFFEAPQSALYELDMIYSGDVNFYSLTCSEYLLLQDSTEDEYRIEVENTTGGKEPDDDIIYGDTIEAKVYKHNFVDGVYTVSEDASASAGIKYYEVDGSTEQSGFFDAGQCVIKATAGGNGIQKTVNIENRNIGLKVNDVMVEYDSFAGPSFDDIDKISGDYAGAEGMADLDLQLLTFDSAGRETELHKEMPFSNYEVTYTCPNGNYDVSVMSGDYLYIGEICDLDAEAMPVGINTAGIVRVINPYYNDVFPSKYFHSAQVVLEAVPYTGFKVDRWLVDNGTQYTYLAEDMADPNKLDLMITADTYAYVYFENLVSGLVFTAENGSVVSVKPPDLTSPVITREGSEITFKAIPDDGYGFVEWAHSKGGGIITSCGTIDGDGYSNYDLVMGDSAEELQAVFERFSYCLTLSENLVAYIDENGNGELDLQGDTEVFTGDEIAGDSGILVFPKPGFTVTETGGAYDWTSDANGVVAAGGQEYSFTMLGDTSVSALTDQGSFQISYPSGEGTITIDDGESETTVGAPYAGTFDGGETIMLTANDTRTRKLSSFSISGDAYTKDDNRITIAYLGNDVEINTAYTDKPTYDLNISIVGDGRLELVANEDEGAKEIFEEDGTANLYEGDNVAITAVPDAGKQVSQWSYDGLSVNSSIKEINIPDLDGGHDLGVEFVNLLEYEVSFGSSGEGDISGRLNDAVSLAKDTNFEMEAYSMLEFTAHPGDGFMVDHWELNGERVKEANGHDLLGEEYMIYALTGDSEVMVYFAAEEDYDVTPARDDKYSYAFDVYPDQLINSSDVVIEVSKNSRFQATVTPADYTVLDEVCFTDGSGALDSSCYESIKNGDDSWTITMESVNEDLGIAVEYTYTPLTNGGGGGGIVEDPIIEVVEESECSDMPLISIISDAIDEAGVDEDGTKNVWVEIDYDMLRYCPIPIPPNFTGERDVELTIEADDFLIEMSNRAFVRDETKMYLKIMELDVEDLEIADGAVRSIISKAYEVQIKKNGEIADFADSEEFVDFTDNKADIKLSLPHGNVEDKHKLVGVYVDKNGNSKIIVFSLFDGNDISLLTKQLDNFAMIYVDRTFNDLGAHQWAVEGIETFASRDVIMGTSSTTYSPSNNITRADYVTLIARCFELEGDAVNTFNDVEEGMYYEKPISIAKYLGILNGVSENTFGTHQEITRQDMMVILENTLKVTGYDERLELSDLSYTGFNDSDMVSSYARDSVDYMIKTGIIHGRNGNMIEPLSHTTRAEVATMLYNMLRELLK